MIETNHDGIFWLMAVAKALQRRGVHIKVLLCNEFLDACEIKNILNKDYIDPCMICKFKYKKYLINAGFELIEMKSLIDQNRYEELSAASINISKKYPSVFYYKNIDLIPIVNDSITRYFYGDLRKSGPFLNDLRAKYLLTAMINADIAEEISKSYNPDFILSNMTVYSEWAPHYQFYKDKGIPVWTLNATANDKNKIVINLMDLFRDNLRFNKYKEFRGNLNLNKHEEAQIDNLITERKKGNFEIFKDKFTEKNVQKILEINKDKTNIFLFPNVYWDLVTTEKGKVFNDVKDWVLSTIDILSGDSKNMIYIKPHPSEFLSSEKSNWGIVNFIEEKFGGVPKNVKIIYPQMNLSPYQLFRYIDLGVVYNGTIGLEMALEGIKVVSLGKSPYSGLDFTFEPNSLNEYKEFLLGKSEFWQPKLSDVKLFTYFYFIKNCIPFPVLKQIFNINFDGYNMNSSSDFSEEGKHFLNHISSVILDGKIPESWEEFDA